MPNDNKIQANIITPPIYGINNNILTIKVNILQKGKGSYF